VLVGTDSIQRKKKESSSLIEGELVFTAIRKAFFLREFIEKSLANKAVHEDSSLRQIVK
jgi:hypothetical protein